MPRRPCYVIEVWCSLENKRGYSQVLGKVLPISHWHSYQPEVPSENTNILCSRITGLSGRKILCLINLKVLLEPKDRGFGTLCPITIHICSNLTVNTMHYYFKLRTSTSHQGHVPLIIFKLLSLTCWSKSPQQSRCPHAAETRSALLAANSRRQARSQHNIVVLISLRNLNPAGHKHQFNLYTTTKWPHSQRSSFQPKLCYNWNRNTLSGEGKGNWQNKYPKVPDNL